MTYSVFPLHKQSHLTAKLFLDNPVNVARYEKVKYPVFSGFTKKQKAFFWQPEEISLTKDQKDFKELTIQEQHIFVSNLLRQALLDSVQGRAPMIAFAPIVSLPELEGFLAWWTAMEQMHSESYTHILRNVFANPSTYFDQMLEIEQIVDCAKDISKYYDDLIHLNAERTLKLFTYSESEHKKALWKALVSVNALEGIRFYVSFACSWAFAETKRMEGNAKIIKFIARDENLHLGATQQLLKMLPKDDPDFEVIRNQTLEECRQIFKSAADQEKAWATYLFKDGSMLGLNEDLLNEYIDWIADKRMKSAGYESFWKPGSNPLPWTQKWIAGGEVVPAPQEVELSSYTSGEIKHDITNDMLKGMSL